jgi:uncharacterized protein YjbI with pentapeptide repeats
MNQSETLTLWQECEDARRDALAQGKSRSEAHAVASAVWTVWARPLIEKRKELELQGEWSAWPSLSGRLIGQNRKTIDFLVSADAVFSSSDHPYTFTDDAIFTGWVFPGRAEFNSATFPATASFNGVMFTDAAEFRETKFVGTAEFQGVTFLADCGFSGGEFARASFQEARFVGRANLAAAFGNDAEFGLARFETSADFGRSRSSE